MGKNKKIIGIVSFLLIFAWFIPTIPFIRNGNDCYGQEHTYFTLVNIQYLVFYSNYEPMNGLSGEERLRNVRRGKKARKSYFDIWPQVICVYT